MLGKIYALSRKYQATNRRKDYFDCFNEEYLRKLLPDEQKELREDMIRKLAEFREQEKGKMQILRNWRKCGLEKR